MFENPFLVRCRIVLVLLMVGMCSGCGELDEAARAQQKQRLQRLRGTLLVDLQNEDAVLEIGDEAPEIEGLDIDGESFKLSDYQGKVVLVYYWGNW